MTAVRQVSLQVTFADVVLDNVLSARGQTVADSGWPTCSVFVTSKPTNGNEEDDITIVAGATNVLTRFTGKVRRFRPSAFPKAIEMVCSGTLAYANEWSPDEDLLFADAFPPEGATDQELVSWALSFVPRIVYDTANIAGTGILLGSDSGTFAGAPEAFDFRAGQTAWNYIQHLDRATLYRTYQDSQGVIRRVRMVGHPDSTPDFTLGPADMLDGATGSRDTERTRNFVRVVGHNYPEIPAGQGQMGAELAGSNDFQGDGSDPATRHVEEFSSDLIESSGLEGGVWDGFPGLRADDIAAAILPDVNKEFVEASVPSWHDELHGPGLTCLLDALDRLAIGEPMWVAGYQWEVGDNGWSCTYSLTGGGLPVSYARSPV